MTFFGSTARKVEYCAVFENRACRALENAIAISQQNMRVNCLSSFASDVFGIRDGCQYLTIILLIHVYTKSIFKEYRLPFSPTKHSISLYFEDLRCFAWERPLKQANPIRIVSTHRRT